MEASVEADNDMAVSLAIPTLIHTKGPVGRVKVGVRVSNKAADLGFQGTVLENAWVTVEVSEEIPHALSNAARRDAETVCRNIAVLGVGTALERLLASVTNPEDVDVIDAILSRPKVFLDAGIAEPLLRMIRAAPNSCWNHLSEDEKRELRQCLE